MGLLSWLADYFKQQQRIRRLTCKLSPKVASDQYFSLLEQIQKLERKGKYKKMLKLCRRSLPLIPTWIRRQKAEIGRFDLTSIPAIELGCQYWPAMGLVEPLEDLRELVNTNNPLKRGWGDMVKGAFEDAELVELLYTHAKENPGAIQSKLSGVLETSQEAIRDVAYYMERMGRLKRKKSGRSYELYAK